MFRWVVLPYDAVRDMTVAREEARTAVASARVAIEQIVGEKNVIRERAAQTADRYREATDRAEKAEDAYRRLVAATVKLKMSGANLPDPARPARIFNPPLDDATIARRRADEEFISQYVEEAVAVGVHPDAAREEAARIRKEVMDGVPGT